MNEQHPYSARWADEHRATAGAHYGLTGPGTSAAAYCPLCGRYPELPEPATVDWSPGWSFPGRRDRVARDDVDAALIVAPLAGDGDTVAYAELTVVLQPPADDGPIRSYQLTTAIELTLADIDALIVTLQHIRATTTPEA